IGSQACSAWSRAKRYWKALKQGWLTMAQLHALALSSPCWASAAPQPDRARCVSRGQDRGGRVRGDGQGVDLGCVAHQRAAFPAGGRVPQLDGTIVIARGDRLPVG